MTKKWKLSLLRILLLASPVYVASVAGGATLDIDTGDPLDCPPSNLFWWSNERGSSFYCIDPRDDGPCDGKGQNGETTGSVSTGCCGASAEKGKEECDTCRDPEAGGGSGTNGEDPADSSTEAGRRIDKDQSCRDCPEAGMPLWSVEEPLLSVRLVDVPMWYKPAFGPKMALKLHYKSLEGSFGHADTRQANIFGFGPGWSTPWRSYIRARDGSSPAEVWVFDGVGNVRSYLVGSPGANAPNYHEKTGAFVETDTVGYVLTHNNGAKDFYAEEVENNSSGAGNGEKIYFLSRREDAVGRGLTFNYSSVTNGGFDQMRLTNIVDAAGLSTTFTYTNVGPMNSLIHKVTNPHGFAAMMLYDANGRLETVVDTISLTSKFVYDGSDRITSVKTPYGTNRFEYVSLSDTNCLAVRVIEKEVRKHLFVFGDLPVDPWPNVADVITSLNNYMDMATNVLATTDFFYKLLDDLKGRDPAAFTNHPSARCSAYWGPLQYQNLTNTIDSSLNNSTFAINSVTTNSYNLAHVTRWRRAWGGFISNTKSFERLPGANINGTEVGPFVFYAYDMGASHLEGTKEGFDNLPAQIFRETMLTDPTDPSLRVWDATQIEYYGVGTVRPGYVKKKMVLERNDFPEPALGIPQFCFRIHRPIRPLTGCSGSGCNRYASGVIQDENEFTCMGVSSYSTNWLASLSGTDGRYIEIVAFPWDASTGGGIGGPGGAPIHYEYHGTNKELSKVTYDGIVEKIRAFNAAGQLQSEKFQQTTGGVTVILWTNSWTYLNGFVRTNIDPRGLAVAYDTDPMGRITKIGFPDSTYVSNRYDRLDLVETIDRNGFSTRYVYDAFRKLLYMTNAMTNVVSFGYCNCGSLSSVTDGNGQVTSYTYDNRGRKTQVTFPGGSWVATKFDAWSHPTNLTTSGGIEQGILYNLKGQVREKWLKSGASWKCIQANLYDSLGRLTTTTNASGLALNLEYDDYDRVTKMIYPDTTFDARAYTTNGILAVTDAAGNSTTYGYDIWGRPMSISSPLGDTVTYGLTPAGDLTSLKNESQAVTQWIYDQYGRVSRKLDATGKTNFVYTYDPGGRLTNQTVPSITASAFVSTTYAYDKVGNVTNIVYPTAGQNVGLAYDKNNRLVTMKDPLGTTAWSYTTFGKLASEDGPWSDDTVGYSYGGDRKVQSMSVSQEGGSAWSQGYTYDGFGRLDKITNPVGTFDYEWTGVSSGDWLGSLVKKLDLPFSNVRTNSYDSMGRLITTAALSGSTVLDSYNYVFANASRITRMNRNANEFASSNHMDYSYDMEGQLLTASGFEGSGTGTPRVHEQWGYKYDPAGNLLQRTNGTGAANQLVETFATNSLNQLVAMGRNSAFTAAGRASASATGVTVQHNGGSVVSATRYADGSFARQGITLANGNNTFVGVATDASSRSASQSVTLSLSTNLTFTYDARGNLSNDGKRRFVYNDRDELIEVYETNVWRSVFSYDGLRRMRVRKEYTWGSNWSQTGEVRYVYSGMLQVQERNAVNQPVVTFTRGLDLSKSTSGAGGIGGLLARYDHSSVRGILYHCDLGGNITALFSSNQVWARYSYDPYGNMQGSVGPLAEVNRYRFSSKELHGNSGLLYYGYRFYDPNLQRWVNRDPLGERGGINLFRFALNRPVSRIDPFGLYVYPSDFVGPLLPGDVRIPIAPPGVSVDDNLSQINAYPSLFYFRDLVRNKGDWDYKQRGKRYQDFGNFNYGATAPWLWRREICRRAGLANVAAQGGNKYPESGEPGWDFNIFGGWGDFGDDPSDQYWINQGIDYSRQKWLESLPETQEIPVLFY